MKNTVILLLFLVCILGLTTGVYYTEFDESTLKITKYEKTVHENDDIITVSLNKIEKEKNALNNMFT